MNKQTRVSAKVLYRLLETQQFKCALTGRALTPDNVSCDHVVPVGRGGHHSIENAQLVTRAVNAAKGSLTNEEFVELCRDVVAWADAKANGSFQRVA